MATHIALLRGINLGGRNKILMTDLRALMSGDLGHGEVATYIQSGNVVFTPGREADDAALARDLEQAIADKLGVRSSVIVLTSGELAEIARANPFPDEPEPKRVHAIVLRDPPGEQVLTKIAEANRAAAAKGREDSVQLTGERTLYLHTPGGYGRSDLAVSLFRILDSPKAGAVATARNWATIGKLLELAGR